MLLRLLQTVIKGIPASVAMKIQSLLDSFRDGIPEIMRRTLLIPAWKY
jgi:hypothetical protein